MATYYCQTKQVFSLDISDDELAELHGELVKDGWADGSESADEIVGIAVSKQYLDTEGLGDSYTEVY